MELKNKTILVTGGAGFLGQHIVTKLKNEGCKKIIVPRSKDCDLRVWENCLKITKNVDIVIHAAGKVGGIGYNQQYPGSFFYDNLMMGAQLMEAARINKVKKFVAIGTICAYPKFTPIPFKEEDLWNGYPEETNAPYGLAKKMLLVQSQAYRQEYNFNVIYLLPVNLYGPGDNFDPQSSHVIPSLIKKFVEAKINNLPNVEVWGTGKASREFLYVEDAAQAIVLATKNYDKPEPVNIGAGFEITIKDLAEKIKSLVNFKGEIKWNTSKPDGQPRRCLDTSRATKEFGFKAKTEFEKGLNEEIAWYLNTKHINQGDNFESVIKCAGIAAVTYWRSPKNKKISKGRGTYDYYSRADEVSEEVLVNYLTKTFPNHGIFSEEFGTRVKKSEDQWIIDPLDGSISFLNGLETWGVSVGHLKNGQTIEAYLYLPITGELFTAKRGKGVLLNGNKISPAKTGAAISVATDYSKSKQANKKYLIFEKLSDHFNIVSYVSTAFSIGSLLKGRVQSFVHPMPDPYDWAGIDLLIKEAGLALSTIEGKPIDRKNNSSLVCSVSQDVHNKVLQALGKTGSR